jgi:uncharacterized protein YgiM (DUF1202 family)
MRFLTGWRHAGRAPLLSRAIFALVALAFALPFNTATGQVQESCTDCTLYAYTELNLRQEPDIDAPVLRFVPAGAAVHRDAGKEVNTYAPVTYDGVPGWVVALGLVASPEEAATSAPVGAAAPAAPAAPVSNDRRNTLEPLLLRSGPSLDAEPILVMPQGATLTLTREGAENGYVTADYGGTLGWVYADLIAEEPTS